MVGLGFGTLLLRGLRHLDGAVPAAIADRRAGRTDWGGLLHHVADATPPEAWALLERVADAGECARSLATLRRAADEAGVALS